MITARLNLLLEAYRIACEQVGDANRGKAILGICFRRCHRLRQIIWPEIRRVRWFLKLITARRAREQERTMNQTALFDQETVLTTDMYVLLQLFTNYRGIDIAQDFFDLCHVYHSVYTHPNKRPKASWSEARVRKAIDACEQADLIAYGNYHDGHKWTITEKGIAARREAASINSSRRHPCR